MKLSIVFLAAVLMTFPAALTAAGKRLVVTAQSGRPRDIDVASQRVLAAFACWTILGFKVMLQALRRVRPIAVFVSDFNKHQFLCRIRTHAELRGRPE